MPLRVLVVDDCRDIRVILRILLRQWGHESCEATDGLSALEAAREFHPDVALLDLGLPGDVDGCEVGRRLRGDEALRGILLVAMTGSGQAEDVARCQEAGFDQHLLKPFDPARLKALLARQGRPELPPTAQAGW